MYDTFAQCLAAQTSHDTAHRKPCRSEKNAFTQLQNPPFILPIHPSSQLPSYAPRSKTFTESETLSSAMLTATPSADPPDA
eukprot:1178992-Rhodomonas_salina.1